MSHRYAVSLEVFPADFYPTFVIGSFYILDRLDFIDASLAPAGASYSMMGGDIDTSPVFTQPD